MGSREVICHAVAKASPNAGLGLFAKKKLEAGDVVVRVARPLLAALDANMLDNACSNCYHWTQEESHFEVERSEAHETVLKACTGCRVAHYCNTNCQSEAWNRHHKWECKELGVLSKTRPVPTEIRMIIQLLQMRAHKKLPNDEWNSTLELESHFDKMVAQHGKTWAIVQSYTMAALLASHESDRFDCVMVQRLTQKIFLNSFTLVTSTFATLGVCFDPLLARANHSCDPNAIIIMDRAQIDLVMLRDVEENEELSISYIDNNLPYHRRQDCLKTRYFFKCSCTKCKKGLKAREDSLLDPVDFTRLDRWLIADCSGIKDFNIPLYDSVSGVSGQRRRALASYEDNQWNRLATIRIMGRNAEALRLALDGLRFCHETRMWPVYRQPYADMCLEAFGLLIVHRRWVEACAQGARLLLDIDPVLYPEPFHPVRITHTWMYTMLLVFLSGEPQYHSVQPQLPKGMSLTLFTISLMNEVSRNVSKCYGAESRFAQMVGRRVAERHSLTDGIGGEMNARLDEDADRHWPRFRELANLAKH